MHECKKVQTRGFTAANNEINTGFRSWNDIGHNQYRHPDFKLQRLIYGFRPEVRSFDLVDTAGGPLRIYEHLRAVICRISIYLLAVVANTCRFVYRLTPLHKLVPTPLFIGPATKHCQVFRGSTIGWLVFLNGHTNLNWNIDTFPEIINSFSRSFYTKVLQWSWLLPPPHFHPPPPLWEYSNLQKTNSEGF